MTDTLPHSHEPLNDGDMNLTPEQENALRSTTFDAGRLIETLEQARHKRDMAFLAEYKRQEEARIAAVMKWMGLED